MPSYGPGALIIPQDLNDHASTSVIISAVDGSTIATGLNLGQGECGAQLANGTLCVANLTVLGLIFTLPVLSVTIFPPSLVGGNTVFPFTSLNWNTVAIASDFAANFWVLKQGGLSNAQVRAITSGGVLGTTYTLDTPNTGSIGVSQDGTRLYYALDTGVSDPIKAWDLIGNAGLGVLVPAISVNNIWGGMILTIPGAVPAQFLVIQNPSGDGVTYQVGRYNATNGATLATYTMPVLNIGGEGPELSLDLSDPSGKFWVRLFPDVPDKTTTFAQISIATGAVLKQFTVNTVANGGVVPESCPLFAWGAPTGSGRPGCQGFGV